MSHAWNWVLASSGRSFTALSYDSRLRLATSTSYSGSWSSDETVEEPTRPVPPSTATRLDASQRSAALDLAGAGARRGGCRPGRHCLLVSILAGPGLRLRRGAAGALGMRRAAGAAAPIGPVVARWSRRKFSHRSSSARTGGASRGGADAPTSARLISTAVGAKRASFTGGAHWTPPKKNTPRPRPAARSTAAKRARGRTALDAPRTSPHCGQATKNPVHRHAAESAAPAIPRLRCRASDRSTPPHRALKRPRGSAFAPGPGHHPRRPRASARSGCRGSALGEWRRELVTSHPRPHRPPALAARRRAPGPTSNCSGAGPARGARHRGHGSAHRAARRIPGCGVAAGPDQLPAAGTVNSPPWPMPQLHPWRARQLRRAPPRTRT
jgi:hypothetical protein